MKARDAIASRPQWQREFKQRELPPIVRVTWLDACSWQGPLTPRAGWTSEYQSGTIQQTVGYKLKLDKSFVTIAQDINVAEHTCRHIVDVPLVNCLEIKELK